MQEYKTVDLFVVAGGTGGHIVPALAIANDLKLQGKKSLWIGSGAAGELHWRNKYPDIDFWQLPSSSLRGKGFIKKLLVLAKLASQSLNVLQLIMKHKPKAIMTFGGYVSGIVGVMAFLTRTPLIIHEQNTYPGLTNRILVRFAEKVITGFPVKLWSKYSNKVFNYGNPLMQYSKPKLVKQSEKKGVNLLILGGSSGAKQVNEAIVEVLIKLGEDVDTINVWHQVGRDNVVKITDTYSAMGLSARVDGIIDDMPMAYDWADLVVCRSGALTISELALFQCPCILCPYPYATDDHQRSNASLYVDKDAALICRTKDYNNLVIDLQKHIRVIFNNDKLSNMRAEIAQFSRKTPHQI